MSHMEAVKSRAGSKETPVEQAIYTLKHSKLPTLVVEGIHDEAIYRWIENLFKVPRIDVLSVNNRDNLLEIYEIYKEELESKTQVPVAFMADLDKWVFDEFGIVEEDYGDIVWTTGYSLENDLYSDGDPEGAYIDPAQKYEHECLLNKAIQHFAYKVATWKSYGEPPNHQIVNKYIGEIKKEYKLKLRGKDLFEILRPFCSARNHLELCQDVFRTLDLDKRDPPLLSALILSIQSKIMAKLSAIKKASPSKKFVAESLFEKLSK